MKDNGIGLCWDWRTFQYEEQHEWGHGGRKLWVISEVAARRLVGYSMILCKRETKIEGYIGTRAWRILNFGLRFCIKLEDGVREQVKVEWPFKNQLKYNTYECFLIPFHWM